MQSEEQRRARRHEGAQADQRSPFQRDRDRILYSSSFRRLAGVAQIVRSGEADVFHTRLTHTLKVAQVGRRLAERRVQLQPDACRSQGVDPEVVEAACLAHDLGHPPFGHLGEEVLQNFVTKGGEEDGYEGNAQAFRILTKLAVRFEEHDGLDLTRATLAAVQKYPWMRDPSDITKRKKWGAYKTEMEDFVFAREGLPENWRTAEAELMDWADDIAYSVHDLEDFHRCRAIPWHLFDSDTHVANLIENAQAAWINAPPEANERLGQAFDRLLELLKGTVAEILYEPYEGTRDQRRQIRFITSKLIGRYIDAIELNESAEAGERCVTIAQNEEDEIRILKQITRDFVLRNPALAAQQKGHERILTDLFEDMCEDFSSSRPKYVPARFKHLANSGITPVRATADCISNLTEAEALALHGRLRGYASGSVLDPIVR